MLGITHVLTGAVVGSTTGSLYISFLFGVIIHLVIFDKIPHFWPKGKLNKGLFLGLDWFLSFLIILLFVKNNYAVGIIGGAIGGLFVDLFILLIPGIYKSKIGKWHTDRQPHESNPIYLLTDFLVIFISLIMLKLWLF